MEQAMVALACIALAAWVLAPMLSRTRTRVQAPDERVGDLLEAKQSVYRSLIDLELDHDLGKLDSGDYDRLRQEGKQEALDLLRQIEGYPSELDDEMQLEEEIRAARARLRRE